MAPIHQAARKNDVVALQRELDAGVSPDLRENDFSGTYRPLADVIVFGSAVRPPETIHRRLACIEALLEAGASLGVVAYSGLTALHLAVARTDRSSYPANFELIVDRLMRAGADVNATNEDGISVLAMAASNGCSTVIAKLLSAGAVDPEGFDEPLRCALFRPEPRICALLMRAGAKLPIPGPGSHQWLERSPYLLKIHRTPGGFLCRSQNCTTRAIGALDDLRTGGFRAYEKAHRQRLTAMFLPKFPSLPAEIVSHIVSFGFNCGCYEFDAVEPVARRTRSKRG